MGNYAKGHVKKDKDKEESITFGKIEVTGNFDQDEIGRNIGRKMGRNVVRMDQNGNACVDY